MSLESMRFLYVEDDVETQLNLRMLLEDEVGEFFSAYNGHEGLGIYEKEKPDIILTDIRMPHQDGLSMAREIKKRDKNQIILVATAFDDKETLIETINVKVDGFVAKPIDFDKLLELLEEKTKEIEAGHEKENIVKLEKDYYWDKQTKILVYQGENIRLTKKERDLLSLLFSAPFDTAFTYEEMFLALWGDSSMMKHDSLKTIVKQLRKKLPQNIIKNVFGIGYAIGIPQPTKSAE